MVSRKLVEKILRIYKEAWVKHDPEKILTIFAKDAVYHEKAFEKPFVGHKQIKRYWQSKVVQEQSQIKFKLLKIYVVKNTAIVEWDASFYSKKHLHRKHIKEVAIIEFAGNRIKSLREYWHSEK